MQKSQKKKNLNKLCNFSSLPYFFNIAHLCNCVNYALMFSLKKLTMLMRYMIYATRRWFKCIKRKLSFQFTTLTIHDELLFKWNVLKANCTKRRRNEKWQSQKNFFYVFLIHIHCLIVTFLPSYDYSNKKRALEWDEKHCAISFHVRCLKWKNKKKLKSKSEKWDNWYAAGDAILILFFYAVYMVQ